jgi:hypothetical protein
VKASAWYRIAAVLLLLFAVFHTLGFSQSDPSWRVDTLLASLRSTHFDILGSQRTFWDFFLAAGYSLGALYLFAAVLAWQLGSLPEPALARLGGAAWTFALAFGTIAVVSALHLFLIPIVFSALITLCLAAAAWLSTRSDPT